MILVFFVIVILFILVKVRNTASSSDVSAARISENHFAYGKTNATLEQRLVDQHMKEGKCFQESYQLAQKEVKELGFEPCIPVKAYYNKTCESSIISDVGFSTIYTQLPEIYDSEFVKRRQRQVESDIVNWYKLHPDEEWPYDFDAEVYDLPTGFWKSFINDKRNAFYSHRIDIGTQVYHPIYGMLTIKNYTKVDQWKTSGYYVLEQSGTGKIIKIKIGDPYLKQL